MNAFMLAIAFMLLFWGICGIWTRQMVLLFKPDTLVRLTGWRAISGGLLSAGVALVLLVVMISSQEIIVHFVGCALNMVYYVPIMILLYWVEYHDFDPDENKPKRKEKQKN